MATRPYPKIAGPGARALGKPARFLHFGASGLAAAAAAACVEGAMHEVGIMESALAAVLGEARRCEASRVHRIVLRIGELSGVEPEALRFAFDVVTAGTPAAGAALEIDAVPARAHCGACAEDFAAAGGWIFSCPRCGRLSGDIRQGRELELARIEMS